VRRQRPVSERKRNVNEKGERQLRKQRLVNEKGERLLKNALLN
jgi:hypothetical protein